MVSTRVNVRHKYFNTEHIENLLDFQLADFRSWARGKFDGILELNVFIAKTGH